MPTLPYRIARALLFRLDAEAAHGLSIRALRLEQSLGPLRRGLEGHFTVDDPRLEQEILGLRFRNPVGLAAGFDKDGKVVRGMASLGFGFLELGTVTPVAQQGNPQPRMFRMAEEASLVNRLGFNNGGAEALEKRLRALGPFALPIGVNLGKNKTTPNAQALDEYRSLAERFGSLASYLVINVSSPNTPGLRDLQNETFIAEVISEVTGAVEGESPVPVFLKITPDIDPEVAATLARAAVEAGADGIVATNTTSDAAFLDRYRDRIGDGGGGVSGQKLCERSFRVFDAVAGEVFGEAVLIAVGGIATGAEAWRRIEAGASLVQLYTGLVFEGPGVVKEINRDLSVLLEREGLDSIAAVVGRRRS